MGEAQQVTTWPFRVLLLILLMQHAPPTFGAFLHLGGTDAPPAFATATNRNARRGAPSTELHVFDFLKQRSQEGMDQLNNLAGATYSGRLGEGIGDLARYVSVSNMAFAQGLAKSRNKFLQNLESIFTGVNPEDVLEELEDILLQADLGTAAAQDIVQEVESLRDDTTRMLSRQDLMSIMRGKLIESLETPEQPRAIQFSKVEDQPTVLFVMGANGMGKTTTIGKLAYRLRTELNETVLLAACDTFRAGAVEQLEQWAERAGVDIVGPSETAKTPAAVLYSALDKALAESYDTVLVDTSGRLSNNDALTAELAKMKRVIQKRLSTEDDKDGKPIFNEEVPHETLLVLDAAQGRMALDSAQVWNKEIGLTGLILTKLDGSARGGSVVAISRDLDLPVKLIGVGEGIEDLRDFAPESFVDGLLGIGEAGGSTGSMGIGGTGSGGTKNEAKFLADRLDEMRKERDARADVMKVQKAEQLQELAPVGGPTSNAPPPASPGKRNRRKNSKKKRKNRK